MAEILSILEAAGSFLVNTLKTLWEFISMIPHWLGLAVTSVGLIPGILLPFAMLGLFITLILLLIGRN